MSVRVQSPTKIHIIPGLPKHRIKPPDILQSPAVESHVAARHMLRLAIG